MAEDFESYRPIFADPYPAAWSTIADFVFATDLHLTRAKRAIVAGSDREAQYIVERAYRCTFTVDGEARELVVPAGMLTDLTSVPRLARWLVGRVGPHLEAAILHDFLFIAWQDVRVDGAPKQPRREDFAFANEVMEAAMAAAGVARWKRALIGFAVSSFVGRQVFFGPNPEPRYVRRTDAAAPDAAAPAPQVTREPPAAG